MNALLLLTETSENGEAGAVLALILILAGIVLYFSRQSLLPLLGIIASQQFLF